MAKQERLFDDKAVTVTVNERVLEYFDELARSGLYGNDYGSVAAVMIRLGISQLIESGAIKKIDRTLPKHTES